MAWERRPGSSTKLASIESQATPAGSTPARRSTCQSYFTLCPALGAAGSVRYSTSGRQAGSVIGGRFRTSAGAASAPSRGRWPKGRYQTSSGEAASESPMSSASCGSRDEVSVSNATSGACRRRSMSGARSRTSSRIATFTAEARRSAEGRGGPVMVPSPPPSTTSVASPRFSASLRASAVKGVGAGGAAAPAPSRRASERNSSSASSLSTRAWSGSPSTSASSSTGTGTSVRMVTSSRESRAASAWASSASRWRLPATSPAWARMASSEPYCSSSWRAPLSPIPFTPGTLSELSPTSAR